jgi:hypothetical protein
VKDVVIDTLWKTNKLLTLVQSKPGEPDNHDQCGRHSTSYPDSSEMVPGHSSFAVVQDGWTVGWPVAGSRGNLGYEATS